MIEIKLGVLKNQQFTQTYEALMNFQGFEVEVFKKVANLGVALQEKLKLANSSWDILLKEWGTEVEVDGKKQFKIPDEKMEAWSEVHQKFHDNVLTFEFEKLDPEDVKAFLSPLNYLVLGPVLEGKKSMEGGH